MSIIIKTRLDSGIYKSCGGGQAVNYYEFKTGVRNLLKAAKILREHKKEMEKSYGNIGRGVSWMEIDGKLICDNDLDEVMHDDALGMSRRDFAWATVESRTTKARRLLARLSVAADNVSRNQGVELESAGGES